MRGLSVALLTLAIPIILMAAACADNAEEDSTVPADTPTQEGGDQSPTAPADTPTATADDQTPTLPPPPSWRQWPPTSLTWASVEKNSSCPNP